MNWTAADMPSQDGQLAIVTGANSGLGFHVALELGRKGAHVILACRDAGRGQARVDRMKAEVPDGDYELRSLDVGEPRGGPRFAAEAPEKIDLLINNAGVMAPPYRKTVDGFESQFGTNYLGHFALTGLLLDELEAADAPRVVTAGSNMHKMGKLQWNDLQSEVKYKPYGAYSQSKLATLMFAFELQRRATAAGSKLLSAAAHPGWSATDLYIQGAKAGEATLMEKADGVPDAVPGPEQLRRRAADDVRRDRAGRPARRLRRAEQAGRDRRPAEARRGQRPLARRGRRPPPVGGLRAADGRPLRVRRGPRLRQLLGSRLGGLG